MIYIKKTISVFLISLLSISIGHLSGKQVYIPDNQVTNVAPIKSQDYYIKVVGITDGDTFTGLTDNKQQVKIRIYGIDAPEKNQAFGARSKQYLSNLIFGKHICIKFQLTKRGKPKRSWDRYIAWAYTPDGKDVSAEMLKEGMAWHFKKYDSTVEYVKYESDARKAKLGLWVDKNPVAPWSFRRKKK